MSDPDNQSPEAAEKTSSSGRIEVAPEVMATIAYYATIGVEGVARTVPPPSNRFRRATAKYEGVVLTSEENILALDIYILVKPHQSMVEISQAVQKTVFEAIDQMVGIPVGPINVHVVNVATADSLPRTDE